MAETALDVGDVFSVFEVDVDLSQSLQLWMLEIVHPALSKIILSNRPQLIAFPPHQTKLQSSCSLLDSSPVHHGFWHFYLFR